MQGAGSNGILSVQPQSAQDIGADAALSYDATELAEYGYEITVRNDLSSAPGLLCREAAEILSSGKVTASQSEERIKG